VSPVVAAATAERKRGASRVCAAGPLGATAADTAVQSPVANIGQYVWLPKYAVDFQHHPALTAIHHRVSSEARFVDGQRKLKGA
jgi:hypothetical protein